MPRAHSAEEYKRMVTEAASSGCVEIIYYGADFTAVNVPRSERDKERDKERLAQREAHTKRTD